MTTKTQSGPKNGVSSEELKWDYGQIFSRLLNDRKGIPVKREFKFRIGKKRVWGWAGVLEKGSRKDAGFTVIQSDRVITGWPDSYRPETLFGSQEGGVNDLVNQRLVGEIFLKGFDVSHTKDEILFDSGEQDRLEFRLSKRLGDLRQIALSYRKYADERIPTGAKATRRRAAARLKRELSGPALGDFIRTFQVPNIGIWAKSNERLMASVVERCSPEFTVKIDKLIVDLYVVEDMSPNDPYVVIESTKYEKRTTVIVNVAHPHWRELTTDESVMNFLRHSTYDGVAEWKAYRKTGKLEPDTVKLLKDNLLRLPFEMEQAD